MLVRSGTWLKIPKPCARETVGLLQRRHVTAHTIAHIGKEANQLDQRESGQLTADDATGMLLEYRNPSVDTWRTDDLPRLQQFPFKEMAALAGLSERRLRDIYAGISKPRLETRLLIRKLLENYPRRQTTDPEYSYISSYSARKIKRGDRDPQRSSTPQSDPARQHV